MRENDIFCVGVEVYEQLGRPQSIGEIEPWDEVTDAPIVEDSQELIMLLSLPFLVHLACLVQDVLVLVKV